MWKYYDNRENLCRYLAVGNKMRIVADGTVHTITKLTPAYLQGCSYDDACIIETDKNHYFGHPFWICDCKSCRYWTDEQEPYTRIKD